MGSQGFITGHGRGMTVCSLECSIIRAIAEQGFVEVWHYEYTPPLTPTVLKEEKLQPAIEYKPPQIPATVKVTAPTYVPTTVEYPKQQSALLYVPEPKYILEAQGNTGGEYVLKDAYGNVMSRALDDVAQESPDQIESGQKASAGGNRGEDKENEKHGVDAKVERKNSRGERVDEWRQHVKDALKEEKKRESSVH